MGFINPNSHLKAQNSSLGAAQQFSYLLEAEPVNQRYSQHEWRSVIDLSHLTLKIFSALLSLPRFQKWPHKNQ